MNLLLLSSALLVATTLAQDTYHCPDGWVLQQDEKACRCFLFSAREQVSRDDADAICNYHDGSWVAEIDYPGAWPQSSEPLLSSVYNIQD